MEWKKKEMNLIGQPTITAAKFVLLILVLAIVPATARSGGSQLPSTATATIVDTLGAATPTTKFSIFGSSGLGIHGSQFAGPEFSLTAPTTITEIGGFANNCISIIAGVPQCPSPPPFVVQIRAAINGVPDSSSIIASFVLSNDGDPFLVSYESARINFTLGPGTYYALFATQSADSGGFLLSGASSPFQYTAGTTKVGFLDVTTGNASAFLYPVAVRIVSSGGCQVSELTPLAELANRYPVGSQFLSELELAAPTTPQRFMATPFVDVSLDVAMTRFQNDVRTRFGLPFPRTSGFRPSAYQAHFREIRDKLDQVFTIRRTPGREGDCQERLDQLLVERAKHFPGLMGEEIPAVNRAGSSAHENNPSNAIDLGDVRGLPRASQSLIDDVIAPSNGLRRPYPISDPVHFILLDRPSAQTIRATVRSPLTILIQDPLGRKVGFDPATRSDVNQIGSTAFYSGPNAEPQYIEISDAMVGTYTVTGIGTSTGPYTLMLERVDEDGEVLESKGTSGIVSLGEIVSLNISLFDTCLQDDSNGNILQFNSITGEYLFTNCAGLTLGGVGSLVIRGSIITLQQNGPDRRVLARIDKSVNRGTASIQILSQGIAFTIMDRNTANNLCACTAR